MKKIHLILIAFAVLAVPFSAQAKTCFRLSCDFIEDGGFAQGGLYWSETGTVTYKQLNPNPCSPLSPPAYVAEINNSSSISQSFYVDDDYTSYVLDLTVLLYNDTDNWYDQLKVTVTNHTTNQAETFYLRGSDFDFTCDRQLFDLQNNYDYSNVTVKLEVSYLNLGTWDVDHVAFFARHF